MTMSIVQCWDDGVVSDARLVDIFARHGALASFNLCAGLHRNERSFGWVHRGVDVCRMGLKELRHVYQGFAIANHSLTHARLDCLDHEAARREIYEGRDRLQQIFGQRVAGFAYPFGAWNDAVMGLVRDAGHVYARTADSARQCFPPRDAMLFHPTCHFLDPDFWQRYESARQCGVFYFWGHSYEMITEDHWADFNKKIERISADPFSCWANVPDIFDAIF